MRLANNRHNSSCQVDSSVGWFFSRHNNLASVRVKSVVDFIDSLLLHHYKLANC